MPGSLLMAVLDFESLFQEEFQGIPLTATKGRLVMNHLHHRRLKMQILSIKCSNLSLKPDDKTLQ